MKRWWCMGCQEQVALDKHGRCEVCESEAVDLIETNNELSGSVSTTESEPESAAVCS
jgi:Zn finger protein HypA/HybF involved in hydrogenase expression